MTILIRTSKREFKTDYYDLSPLLIHYVIKENITIQ